MERIVTLMLIISPISCQISLLNSTICDPLLSITKPFCTPNTGYPTCDNLKDEYDIIIVGGGTAGCVLANRLTEIQDWDVLLLEVGNYPSDRSDKPLDFIFLQETPETFNFKQTQDNFFTGQMDNMNKYPQGRVLGGGSTVNAMIYAPGEDYDYDQWAIKVQNDGWNSTNVKPYFKKTQQYVRTSRYRALPLARTYLEQGAKELGISVNDPNSKFGYSDILVTTFEHRRFSMAKAYLKPIVGRSNFCLRVNTAVTRIIIDEATMTATGVEIQTGDGLRNISARLEVILTAGAINSPRLLTLSGIGQASELSRLGIRQIQELDVGRHLKDHVIVPIFAIIADLPSPTYLAMNLSYCICGNFLDNIGLANFIGFFNTQDVQDYPDVEFMHFAFPMGDVDFLPAFIEKFGGNNDIRDQLLAANKLHSILIFAPIILHPKSEGYVSFVDTKLDSNPIINPQYFTEREDLQVLVDAVHAIIDRMVNTKVFSPFGKLLRLKLPKCDIYLYNTFEYWSCYVTMLSGTIYHPTGTCRMGDVVDPRMRVKGINKLRVSDSSTIPDEISGHTNIPTCMLAEKSADLFKMDYNKLN